MQRLFVRIVLWFGALLVFSVVAFYLTVYFLQSGGRPMDRVTRGTTALQLELAREAFETGGREGLQREIERIDRLFPAKHYLLDEEWRDVLTGEDRSAAASQVRPPRDSNAKRIPSLPGVSPPLFGGPLPYLMQQSADGKYRLLVEPGVRYDRPNLLPYFLWIVAVLVLLSWTLAWTLARPLKRLRDRMSAFAAGDLGARAGSRRKDEIGDVARAFDTMADRIETLLTAERRLLQDISHELRSPLARLNLAVELAKKSGDREAALERIRKESARLSTLVGALIEMTRVEGDPAARTFRPLDLRALVASVADDCRVEGEAKFCEIRTRLEECGRFDGDEEMLRRAVENVVRNAVNHSPQFGVVEVALERSNGSVRIAVKDQGSGVPDEQIEKIFHPFYRVGDDRSRANGGVGLGLAIARRAVLLHHGRIGARNVAPGMEVEILLPVTKLN